MTLHPVGGVCFAAAGLALAAAAGSSQAAWEKVFSDSSTTTNVEIRAIERLTLNATSTRVYIAGNGGFPGLAPVRMELAFWDGLGNRTHRHEYLDTSAGSHFELRSLHQMANGDYLIAGSSTVGSGQRQFLMRVDADLRPIWNRSLSHSVLGSGAIEAIELPSGDIMVMDVVTLNGFACTRLTKWTGAGGYIDSRALTGPGGENVVLNDIDLDPATQMLWGAGTVGSLNGSACLAVIPAQTGFPGPYTLAVYVGPAVSASTSTLSRSTRCWARACMPRAPAPRLPSPASPPRPASCASPTPRPWPRRRTSGSRSTSCPRPEGFPMKARPPLPSPTRSGSPDRPLRGTALATCASAAAASPRSSSPGTTTAVPSRV